MKTLKPILDLLGNERFNELVLTNISMDEYWAEQMDDLIEDLNRNLPVNGVSIAYILVDNGYTTENFPWGDLDKYCDKVEKHFIKGPILPFLGPAKVPITVVRNWKGGTRLYNLLCENREFWSVSHYEETRYLNRLKDKDIKGILYQRRCGKKSIKLLMDILEHYHIPYTFTGNPAFIYGNLHKYS